MNKRTATDKRASWAHTPSIWRTNWTPDLVMAAPDPVKAFAEYCQQICGVPWPTGQDMLTLRKKVNEFFDHYPRLDWYSLCRVAQWCRSTRRRLARVWQVVDAFRPAFVAGALPELNTNRDEDLDAAIGDALTQESDRTWRRRLLVAQGNDARRAILAEWRRLRG